MFRIAKQFFAVTLAVVSAGSLAADTMQHRVSVRQVMMSAITPATNTLWGAEDSQDDAAWLALADAAVVVIASGTLIKTGGSGDSDAGWAAEPAWQGYADVMISAAADALAATETRDIDALMTATEVMYPPCEECHAQFHPDMQE
jgi:cytochrome c556